MLNQKGLATLETLPIIFVFIVLLTYTFGFFGIIHTGILNSIAARNYAFEVFRHRSNLSYFRSNPGGKFFDFVVKSNRIHGIASEFTPESGIAATERLISMGMPAGDLLGNNDRNLHNSIIPSGDQIPFGEQTQREVNPVWIMTFYGMCLNASCEPRQ